MRKVNLKYAKDHLENLLEEALAGEDVISGENSLGAKSKRALVESMCAQLGILPDLDTRSPDEILGYNDWGLF